MPNHSYTHLILIVDASGSMQGREKATIDGVNEYLSMQKNNAGQTTVSLTVFANHPSVLWDTIDISQTSNFNRLYRPDGGTALLDAIGTTIQSADAKFQALPDHRRPGRVVCVIVTDGEENASSVFGRYNGGREKVGEMIKHHEAHESWDFFFLGAGIDAITAGSGLGVTTGKTASFPGDAASQRQMWLATNAATQNARSGDLAKDADFFGEEWRKPII
jgi:hypothetical protein